MHRSTVLTPLLTLLVLVLTAAACGSEEPGAGTPAERGTVIVGSTNFAEQEIVASMYAAVLEDAGYTVDRRFQLGSREVVFPALQNGEIDLIPEYVGTLLEFVSGGAGLATSDTQESIELLREELGDDLVVLEPAEAQDKNALVVTQETADELGLESVSDLQGQAGDLVLGGPPECPQRPLCLPGYEETYGLDFGEFRALDAGGPLTVSALQAGDIDVALMFSTQGVINANDWVLLEDDQGLQPAENLVPVIRAEVLTDEIRSLLNEVSAALTTEALTELNRRVDVDGEAPADAAQAFLQEQGLVGG